MQTIEIDFDVFKALTARRRKEADSYNDVLREILNLEPIKKDVFIEDHKDNEYWVSNGGKIPVGTRLKSSYKGKQYEALVTNRGIEYNGNLYKSPSGPAVDITGHNTNGFVFWEAQPLGSNEWRPLSEVRS